MMFRFVFVLLAVALSAHAHKKSAFPDDDRECKRHKNEGVCTTVDGHYTCGCLFHEKPKLAISEWNAADETRFFTQTCEPLKLPYHEDTCVVLPSNPEFKEEYEFLCPNNGFFQTWGAFTQTEGSSGVRLWHRCCEAQCPKWNCQWSPFNEPQGKFVLPLDDAFVQGVRGRYVGAKKDTSWSLRVCSCDVTATSEAKEEL